MSELRLGNCEDCVAGACTMNCSSAVITTTHEHIAASVWAKVFPEKATAAQVREYQASSAVEVTPEDIAAWEIYGPAIFHCDMTGPEALARHRLASSTPTTQAPDAVEPLGFKAAGKDWNEAFAGRPYNLGDWHALTLGEQQRYARQECKTKGAVYSSRVTANRIEFAVALPPSLAMDGLQQHEAEKVERWLHNALEKEIAGILQLRELSGGRLPQ